MKINLAFNFTNLLGKEISGESAGKILAAYLSTTNKGNSIKLWDWALKLYNDKDLEIDSTDADVLIGLIENAENLTVLAKAQILNYINSVKEIEKSK